MSAAATAAGYLYASGRLRGRNAREGESEVEVRKPAERRRPKIAVIERPVQPAAAQPQRPKSTPRIEYRPRRWRPE